jgi:hypothetical protein
MITYEAYIPLPPDDNQPKNYNHLVSTAVKDTLETQPELKRCAIQEKLLIWHQRLAHMPLKTL